MADTHYRFIREHERAKKLAADLSAAFARQKEINRKAKIQIDHKSLELSIALGLVRRTSDQNERLLQMFNRMIDAVNGLDDLDFVLDPASIAEEQE